MTARDASGDVSHLNGARLLTHAPRQRELLARQAARRAGATRTAVARWRTGEDDEPLSPLLMPSLAIASTLEQLLKATAEETIG